MLHNCRPQHTFTDKDLILSSLCHNRPLYMRGTINGRQVNRILVNAGAAINIMPLKTFQSSYLTSYLQKVNAVKISGFNQDSEDALYKIEVKLAISDFITQVTFNIINADTYYKVSLGRPWLHENWAVPLTLHQCLKYNRGREQHTVFADQTPFYPNKCHLANASLYFGEPTLTIPGYVKDKGK